MPYKKGCFFNQEVQNTIFNIYRGSNLEVLEYLVKILPQDEKAKEFLDEYLAEPVDIDEQDTNMVDIFWKAMDYYGLTEIIRQKNSES